MRMSRPGWAGPSFASRGRRPRPHRFQRDVIVLQQPTVGPTFGAGIRRPVLERARDADVGHPERGNAAAGVEAERSACSRNARKPGAVRSVGAVEADAGGGKVEVLGAAQERVANAN